MPLHGMITLNGLGIIDWYVGRLDAYDDQPPDDSVNTYHWWVQVREEEREREGELLHRYGDGALVLVAKVLAAAAES